QEYFVREKASLAVVDVAYAGAGDATPAPGVVDAIADADVVVVCPSNPVTSIGPILAVPGLVAALHATRAPVIGVSPIVGDAPVSGPAGALMRARGLPVSSPGVAQAYRGWLDSLGVDVGGAALDAVWVTTRDDAVSAIARALGATVLGERENRGHTAAVALAQQRAAEAGAHVFVTIPGDVPLVTADEIRTLAAAARSASAAFTPSRSRLGTNGVALSPPTLMPLTFGEPSFDNHLAAARERGLTPAVLALPGLGVDIDSPEDLPLLLAEGAATDSARLLARWDVAARPATAVTVR